MTAVRLRIVAPDQRTRDRAARQLAAAGVMFADGGLPPHPGERGDWLAYGTFEVEPAPGEPTRRRPDGAR